MDVKETVERIINEQTFCGGSVKPTDRLVEDLVFDSMDCVEMLMALEDAFVTNVPDEIAEEWKTVQDVINYFEN